MKFPVLALVSLCFFVGGGNTFAAVTFTDTELFVEVEGTLTDPGEAGVGWDADSLAIGLPDLSTDFSDGSISNVNGATALSESEVEASLAGGSSTTVTAISEVVATADGFVFSGETGIRQTLLGSTTGAAFVLNESFVEFELTGDTLMDVNNLAISLSGVDASDVELDLFDSSNNIIPLVNGATDVLLSPGIYVVDVIVEFDQTFTGPGSPILSATYDLDLSFTTAVPEPSSFLALALFALTPSGVAFVRRRKATSI